VANPLNNLGKVLVKLAEQVDVLPAAGGAVEDLVHPEIEEREDRLVNWGEQVFDTIIESPSHDLYCPTPPLCRPERHTFRYFLDGSFRSYFVGTALEGNRDTPVHFAQIGASLLRRLEDGNVKVASVDVENALLLSSAKLSEATWQAVELAARESGVTLIDISREDQFTQYLSAEADLRTRAGGKVRYRMREVEKDLTLRHLPLLVSHEWMIVDGSLMFQPLQDALCRLENPRVLGVSKSFRRDPQFSIGRGVRSQRFNITRLLADLQHEHRTAAFSALEGKVAFWYVRIREQGVVDYPLMGVIKAELVNPSQGAIDSELIDFLSRCLVAERSVTPYGVERRWHACLYPIYMAEQAVKNAFLSREVIRASLRWPIVVRR
jgi:hypothetical protein